MTTACSTMIHVDFGYPEPNHAEVERVEVGLLEQEKIWQERDQSVLTNVA